jgi:hypothetical protein
MESTHTDSKQYRLISAAGGAFRGRGRAAFPAGVATRSFNQLKMYLYIKNENPLWSHSMMTKNQTFTKSKRTIEQLFLMQKKIKVCDLQPYEVLKSCPCRR